MKNFKIITVAVFASLLTFPAYASDTRGSHSEKATSEKTEMKGSHSGEASNDKRGSNSGDHSAMKAPEGKTEAKAIGVINTIDAEKKSINVTHEPVEALGWPKMTMDLPVTKRVDLTKIKTGEKVEFTLKQGRDKQYRVIEIGTAK